MNPSLNSLKLALRLAIEDADVTAYDITTTLRETTRDLSQAHQVRSNKADAVCTGLSLSDTMAPLGRSSLSDTVSVTGEQPVSPYFGAGGGDIVSFS